MSFITRSSRYLLKASVIRHSYPLLISTSRSDCICFSNLIFRLQDSADLIMLEAIFNHYVCVQKRCRQRAFQLSLIPKRVLSKLGFISTRKLKESLNSQNLMSSFFWTLDDWKTMCCTNLLTKFDAFAGGLN